MNSALKGEESFLQQSERLRNSVPCKLVPAKKHLKAANDKT